MELQNISGMHTKDEVLSVLEQLPVSSGRRQLHLAAMWTVLRLCAERGESFEPYQPWYGQHLAGELRTGRARPRPVLITGVPPECSHCALQPQALVQALRRAAVVIAVKFELPPLAALRENALTVYEQTASRIVDKAPEILVRLSQERTARQTELVECLWTQQQVPLRFEPFPSNLEDPGTPLFLLALSWFQRTAE